MKCRRVAITVFLFSLIFLSSIQVGLGYIVENVSNDTSIGHVQQESVFYIPNLDTWIVFYTEGITKLYYEVSYNGGLTWLHRTEIPPPLGSQFSHSWSFDVTMNLNKTHCFVLHENSGFNQKLSMQKFYISTVNNPSIGVFVGQLVTGAGWDTVLPAVATYSYYDFSIMVDSNNIPWVTYHREDSGGADLPYVTKSNNTSGDWRTDAGYPHNLLFNSGRWYIQQMRLVNGAMMFVYYEVIGGSGGRLRYNYYNGTDFNGSLTLENTVPYQVDDIADRFDTTYKGTTAKVVWVTFNDFDLYYKEFDQINETWSAREFVALGESETYPKITTQTNNDLDVIVYGLNNETINYVIRDDSVYSDKVVWVTDTDLGTEVNSEVSITKNGRYTVRNQLGYVYSTDTASWDINFLPIALGYPPDAPILIENSTILTDIWGNNVTDDWLFRGEVYSLTATFNNTEYCFFNITDGEHEIRFNYDNRTGDNLIYTEGGDEYVIGLTGSDIIYNGSYKTITWIFTFDLNVIDIVDIDFDCYAYDRYGNYTIWGSVIKDKNIYNLGGLTSYTFTGDGGRVTGGREFDLHVENGTAGSTAIAQTIYRKLQHFHALVEIDQDNEYDVVNGEFDFEDGSCYIEYLIDYRYNLTWVNAFRVRIYPQASDVGTHNLGNDADWIRWIIEWYAIDPSTGNVSNVDVDFIISNHWGYDSEHGFEYTNRTSSQLFVDLWFDRTNASTTVGGMVYPYYFGMIEQGNPWWFGWGNFRPLMHYPPSKFLWDLYDSKANIINSINVNLVRLECRLVKLPNADGDDEEWFLQHTEVNKLLAPDRMQGIDEPTIEETKVIDMPQGGLLAPLIKAFNAFRTGIWKGLVGALSILWGAIDTLMEFAGLGEWWRAFSATLGSFSDFFIQMTDDLIMSMTDALLLVEQLFLVISTTFGRLIFGIQLFISGMLNWYNRIVALFTGGLWGLSDMWVTFNMLDWTYLFINLLPLYWIYRIYEADDKILTIKNDISFVIMLVTGMFNFLSSFIFLSIAVIEVIIGVLPI